MSRERAALGVLSAKCFLSDGGSRSDRKQSQNSDIAVLIVAATVRHVQLWSLLCTWLCNVGMCE